MKKILLSLTISAMIVGSSFAQLADITRTKSGSGLDLTKVLTNGGFTINGQAASNGANFSISGGSGEGGGDIYSNSNNTFTGINTFTNKVGIGTSEPIYPLHVVSDIDDHDSNFIVISGKDDKTKGFSIEHTNGYKWAQYIYEGEDGDTLYTASGNSGRDVMVMQSGGRVGINVPTKKSNIQISIITQRVGNAYATVTTEINHRLAALTPITIVGATNEKFLGQTMVEVDGLLSTSFRIAMTDTVAIKYTNILDSIFGENAHTNKSITEKYVAITLALDDSADPGVAIRLKGLFDILNGYWGNGEVWSFPYNTSSYSITNTYQTWINSED